MIVPLTNPKVRAVFDSQIREYIANAPFNQWYNTKNIFLPKDSYKEKFKQWLLNSKFSSIKGLDKFKKIDFTFGVTQSIDDLLLKHKNDRLRFFHYEYHYSRKLHSNKMQIFLDDIRLGDWVLVSLPFCFNGGYVENFKEILDICYSNNVPVYIDAAFYMLSFDFELDLTHPAIKEVYFSLSKNLGLGFLRTGIRFSNESYYGPITMQNEYNYSNLAYIELGSYLIEKFDVNYTVEKYYPFYKEFCRQQNLEETNCVHIAMSNQKLDDSYLCINNKTKIGLWWEDEIL